MLSKKELERLILDKYLISSSFELDKIIPHESPDFILISNDRYHEFIVHDIISNDDFGNPLEVKTVFYDKYRKSPSEPKFEYYKYQYYEKGNCTKQTKTTSGLKSFKTLSVISK